MMVHGDGCSDRILLRVAPPICKVPAVLPWALASTSRGVTRGEQLLVYSYNEPAPLNPPTYFCGFLDSQLQTSDPEKACLFFVYSDTETNENYAWWWQKPHHQSLPFWNNGMNHVIITFADR